MLNPMIVDGQVVGGAVDGMGCTMLSELLYNEDGQLISGTLADYLVMAATDAPTIRLDHVQTLPTTNPLGVRGVGEGAVLPVAPAIVGAITRIADPWSVERENHLYAVPLKPTSILLAMGDR
jgi:carbon-monoxide dehydrogenase large subunit